MTPKEKWRRMSNPKFATDYGFSIKGEELKTFREGRKLLKEINKIKQENKFVNEIMRNLGYAMAKRLDRTVINVLH